MATLEKSTLFPPELVKDLVNKVKGKSSLARLSGQEPIAFNGQKEFTFSMDNEVDVVAESGAKSHGGVTIDPITIIPIKVEYGARISDEFMIADEEAQANILKAFNDGFAKKVARGLDFMAFHGINPRTGAASTVIGDNHFDSKVTQMISYDASTPEDNIESAVKVIRASDGEVSGAAFSNVFASALATLKVNGVRQYPELAWGSSPDTINGLSIDVNNTVYNATTKDQAILGDFAESFKWGYAKEVPMEVIRYGDPDNSGNDLRGYNQVYVRAEAYLGWGILIPSDFARIVTPQTVTFTATPDGTAGTTSSTKIDMSFNVDVYGMTAANIKLEDDTGKATKGALTGSKKTWSLAITPTQSGNIKLTIENVGGYTMPATKTVAIIKA